jgi:predicted site-specific integrase-resolvase
MMPEYTVKELAYLDQVDERTVRRWIEKGAVHVRRTIGGGIRIVLTHPHPADRRTAARFSMCADDGNERAFPDNDGHLSR